MESQNVIYSFLPDRFEQILLVIKSNLKRNKFDVPQESTLDLVGDSQSY